MLSSNTLFDLAWVILPSPLIRSTPLYVRIRSGKFKYSPGLLWTLSDELEAIALEQNTRHHNGDIVENTSKNHIHKHSGYGFSKML